MKRQKVQKYEMIMRVKDLGFRIVTLFPQHTIAEGLVGEIASTCATLSQLLSARVSIASTIRERSHARAAARNALKTLLNSICRTARVLGIDTFRVASKNTDPIWMSTGRAFAVDTAPWKEQFILHGMSPEFTEDLNAAVRNLEAAMLSHVSARATRAAIIREFGKTLNEASNQVKRFEALIHNTMSGNASVMIAWEIARCIGRSGPSKPAAGAESPPVLHLVPAVAAGR